MSAEARRHDVEDSRTQPACQLLAPPSSEEGTRSGDIDSGNSSGGRTPSENSPPSAQEQCRSGGAQESPIRGLIIPEHPADSRVIAESMERVLREDSSACGGDGSCWNFPLGVGSPHSLSDKAARLRSQPLDDIYDSASSSGFPGEALADCAPESEPAEEQAGDAAEQAALLPADTSSGIKCLHKRCNVDHATQEGSSGPEGSVASLPDGAELADTAGSASAGHDSMGHASCSAASEALPDDLALITESAADLRVHAAMQQSSAARLLPRLGITAAHKCLGGGVALIALMAAARRRSGILQLLRLILRAFAIYGETMQRLR